MSADTEFEKKTREGAAAGEFVRRPTAFRSRIEAGGEFPPELGRYHLVVARACPWAHRVTLTLALRGLPADAFPLTVVDWLMGEGGWSFSATRRGCAPFPLRPEFSHLRQLYFEACPGYEGRFTVPLLWDSRTSRIVNNESSEIIRFLNAAYPGAPGAPDLYPEPRRAAIDAANDRVYGAINDGVYRCGFARTQEAYDRAAARLHEALAEVEATLARRRFLVAGGLTEADVRLFPTLLRLSRVYAIHFKCAARLRDYPALLGYVREIYQMPGVRATVDWEHIARHYYESHVSINPHRIVAAGFVEDLDAPHGRGGVPAGG